MSTKKTKNTTEDDNDLDIVEAFQVNLLDLVTYFNSLTVKINSAGVKSPCSSDTLKFGHVYIKSRNPRELITIFITETWKNWELCSTKDEDILFKNVKALFPGIPDDNLLTVRQLFDVVDSKGKKIVTEENKEDIWGFITELIRMGIIYIHSERCWGKKSDGKLGYTKVFFKDISISKYATLFNVEISKPTSS